MMEDASLNFVDGNALVISSAAGLLACVEEKLEFLAPSSYLAIIAISLSRSDHIEAVLRMGRSEKVDHQIIKRLSSLLKAEDHLAIPSPNEIWIVLSGLSSESLAHIAVINLLNVLEVPITDGDTVCSLQAWAGLALVNSHNTTSISLVKTAINLSEQARAAGRRYTASLENGNVLSDNDIAQHLTFALSHNLLSVAYQPKIHIASKKVVGLEALIRWNDPPHPSIGPEALVSTAERYGMIQDLTWYVVNTAMRECATTLSKFGIATLWVNISVSMLRNEKLPAKLRQLCDVWGIEPQKLGLEVTESALLTDIERSLSTLNTLVQMGFHLAIDDFGTGYSSLAYLRQLPVAEIKIDKVFVKDIATSHADREIVQAVTDLAHRFGMVVVAEGAEDSDTLRLLADIRCDQVQGYIFSKPLAIQNLLAWLKHHEANHVC